MPINTISLIEPLTSIVQIIQYL